MSEILSPSRNVLLEQHLAHFRAEERAREDRRAERLNKVKIAGVAGYLAIMSSLAVVAGADAWGGKRWFMKPIQSPKPPVGRVYQTPEQPLQTLFSVERSKIGHDPVKVIVKPSERLDAEKLTVPTAAPGETVHVQPELMAAAQKQVDAVNAILTPENQIRDIHFDVYGGQSEVALGGFADPNAIQITTSEGVRLSPEDVAPTAFHESMHVLQMQAGNPDAPSTYGSSFNKDYGKLRAEELAVQQLMGQIMRQQGFSEGATRLAVRNDEIGSASHDEQLGSLIAALDESSYGAEGGHPNSNQAELMASTLTVLRFFPESFISSTNNLNANDKDLILKTAQDAVRFLYLHGTDKEAITALFEPEILSYIGINAEIPVEGAGSH